MDRVDSPLVSFLAQRESKPGGKKKKAELGPSKAPPHPLPHLGEPHVRMTPEGPRTTFENGISRSFRFSWCAVYVTIQEARPRP